MGKDLEKSIKRFLKRRVKITLGFIVAFLLSCSFTMGEGLYIQNNADTNEVEFSKDNSTWGENPYQENEFKENIYTINGELKTDRVSLVNFANGISLINNGGIIVESTNNAWGIDNSGEFNKIENNGILSITAVNNTTGIYNSGTIDSFVNNGLMKIESQSGNVSGISNYNSEITTLKNNGRIEIKSSGEIYGIDYLETNGEETINSGEIFAKSNDFGTAINYDNSSINFILNEGLINISSIDEKADSSQYLVGIQYSFNTPDNTPEKIEINNVGVIKSYAQGELDTKGILYSSNISNSIIENTGSILSYSGKEALGISISTSTLEELKNNGVIYANGTDEEDTSAIYISGDIKNLKNNGIMGSNNLVIKIRTKNPKMEKIENNGLFVGELRQSFFDNDPNNNPNFLIDRIDEFNKGFVFKVENGKYTDIKRAKNSGNIINANLNGNGETGTQSIAFENQNQTGKIYNGITDTLLIKGKNSLSNSTVNGYTNAVVFDNAGGELTLDSTTINGGLAENSFAIKGQNGNDILSLSNESIITGNVNLNDGNDNLSLDDSVQINGTLDGGTGNNDILTFNSSVTKSSSDKNINILHDIKGFEKTDIYTNVTLFEKTVGNNGETKNLVAELGDITIKNNGELTLRVDGSQKDGDKIIGHALYENKGSLQTDKTGKLILGLYGVGNEAVVGFGNTDISNLNSDNVGTSSYLHNIKVNGDENIIEISAKENLEDLDIANYDKLNKIYHSILTSQNLDKFNVEEEQKGEFFKYLHDIYVGNPYAYSSELSRKTMGMMRNLADRDLHPELNKWVIYGGLSHVDGGTKENFYGRNYYGYDIGSRDIKADTKITGGYFKAEYGKSESLTTGIIFGGNNAESEIGNSKVEGDSFYFGGYAKKFINDFRFTLGAGFQHGDYKADRTAVGYEGITETRKFDSNYHDRGFDIYGDIKYSREIGSGLFFEPSFALSYTYLDEDGAREKGTLGIETDSKTFDYLSSEINLDVRKTFMTDKLTHSFVAGVSYERLLNGYDEEYITGRIIGGTDFDILVPEKEKDNFFVNAKYELETEKGMLFDVKCSYRFEHDNNQDEWTVGVGMGYKF